MLSQALAELAFRMPRFRGRDRVMRALIRAAAGKDGFVVERGRVRYKVRGEDLIDYYVMSELHASPAIVDFLVYESADRATHIWDIGANVGSVLLPVLSGRPLVTGVAFEPSPDVCGRLLRNLALNPALAARCTVASLALSDASGWTRFFVSNESWNSGVGGLEPAPSRQNIGPLVRTMRGEEALEFSPPPDLIKIDVEGYEEEVLRGLGQLLDRPLVIVFEHALYRLRERKRPARRRVSLPRWLRVRGHHPQRRQARPRSRCGFGG